MATFPEFHNSTMYVFICPPANGWVWNRLENWRGTTKNKKIVGTNWQSNFPGSCQSIFSLSRHLPRESKFDFLATRQRLGWRQDNGNKSNQESKFDFLATRQCVVKIDEGQQKIKIIRTIRVPANQFSPSPGTSLVPANQFSPTSAGLSQFQIDSLTQKRMKPTHWPCLTPGLLFFFALVCSLGLVAVAQGHQSQQLHVIKQPTNELSLRRSGWFLDRKRVSSDKPITFFIELRFSFLSIYSTSLW